MTEIARTYGPTPKIDRHKMASGHCRTAFTYTVVGQWEFPLDMLRYDAAWPNTEKDAAMILGKERRPVRLCSHQAPTPERWASFGWKVE